MTRPRRLAASMLVLLLMLSPMPSAAMPPVLLLLVKQLVKDAAQSMLKDMVLSTLNGMGCKGMAIANALQAIDLRKGGAGGTAATLGGMPKLPGTMPGMPGMAGIAALPGGLAGGNGDVTAQMRALMPDMGQLPAGTGVDAEQMSRMMQAMNRPLSPPETVAMIDDMTEIGFLPKAIQAELKECLMLLPAAAPALGVGMAMLRPMLPQLREARAELHALGPAEQDEVVAMLAPEIKVLTVEERKALLEFLGSGFFPKRVAGGLRAQLAKG